VNVDQTVKFLKVLGVEHIQQHKRTGWVISPCPLGPWRHENGESGPEVFGIKVEPGDAPTHCFSCDWHGTMGDLVVTMRHLNKTAPAISVKWGDALRMVEEAENEGDMSFDFPDVEEMLLGEKAKPHIFPDWWLDSFASWRDAPLAGAYLGARRVPTAVADALDLRWDSKEKRICFPVRDFAHRLLGLHGRAIEKDVDPRYRMYTQAKRNNPLIWLGENWVDLERPIVVVEGPFDVTSVYRVYRNVVSPLFSNPSFDKLMRMADCLEWITIYDRGAGGDAGRAKVSKFLNKDHVLHHLQPPVGRKDPGDCKAEEIVQLLDGMVPLDPLLT
jgi:hypothetical protein